jgi:hypothetical protein
MLGPEENGMSELELDKNNLELALRCVEQIQKCVSMVKSRIEEAPGNADALMRPSVCLMEKLLEAQGEVQGLIDTVNRVEVLIAYVGR